MSSSATKGRRALIFLSTRQKMLAARIVQRPVTGVRHLMQLGPFTEVSRRGVRWFLDLREGIDFSIWIRGYFEPSTVATYRRLIRHGATVLDVGANIGAHTLHLAMSAGPPGIVIAFEPATPAFERLAHNVALNPNLSERIQLQHMMLVANANQPIPEEIVASWPLVPLSQLDALALGRAQPTYGAISSRLDDALYSLGVTKVDFMKLDVDGYEVDVLQGAPRLLSESRPTILLELAPSHLESIGRRIEDVLDLLAAHRYQVKTMRRDRDVTTQLITLLRRTNSSINVVAAPTAPHRSGP